LIFLLPLQPARHSKLEKADILEMTVKHLQDVQRQQIAFATLDPTVMHKFKTGFSDCADEVGNYIQRIDGIESGVKQRLITHLHSCINNMESSMVGFGGSSGAGSLFGRGVKPFRGFGGLSQDVNNNGRMQVNGVQLIPSRLPTGELALVMPNSSSLPFFPQSFTPTNCFDLGASSRQSAFNTVTKRPLVSPPLSPVSSLSSFDDHTNDFTASRTPPPQMPPQFGGSGAFASAFPTPPSGGSIGPPVMKPTFSTGQPHQQPFVSSTTPSTGVGILQHHQIETVKRSHWDMEGGEKHLLATIKKEPSLVAVPPAKVRKLNESPSPAGANEEGQDNMWRPW
jgi:hairy and enhancer of split, invertebrate